MFDHEKLEVYRFELRFVSWVADLLEEVRTRAEAPSGEIRNQLDRASLSALLNTAEGNSKRQAPLRAKYFDDARGSAIECAACLDALVAKKLCTNDRVSPGKPMLLSIVRMLVKLSPIPIGRESSDSMVREDVAEYVIEE